MKYVEKLGYWLKKEQCEIAIAVQVECKNVLEVCEQQK